MEKMCYLEEKKNKAGYTADKQSLAVRRGRMWWAGAILWFGRSSIAIKTRFCVTEIFASLIFLLRYTSSYRVA